MNGLALAVLICGADLGSPVPPLEARVAALEWRVTNLEARDARVQPLATSNPTVQVAAPTIRESRIVGAQPIVIPPGFHGHRTVDGRTIVHSDANLGSAAAHAGVAYPWPKTAYAGQVVYGVAVTGSAQSYAGSSACPGGVCPTARPAFAPFGGRFRR